MLKLNPIDVMTDVQRFLKVSPIVDYSNLLRFDVKKGFFCQIIDGNHTKCLGKSKGKQYPPMEERSLKLLQRYVLGRPFDYLINCLTLFILHFPDTT